MRTCAWGMRTAQQLERGTGHGGIALARHEQGRAADLAQAMADVEAGEGLYGRPVGPLVVAPQACCRRCAEVGLRGLGKQIARDARRDDGHGRHGEQDQSLQHSPGAAPAGGAKASKGVDEGERAHARGSAERQGKGHAAPQGEPDHMDGTVPQAVQEAVHFLGHRLHR